MTYEDYLAGIYYDPEHAGSYGGLDKLYRAVRKEGRFVLGKNKIRKWLLQQEDYAVHREERTKIKRRRVVAPFVDYQWDVDTAHMDYYQKDNDGYGYFLLAVDIMSKYVWTVALKTRTGKEMVNAFRQVFEKGRKPTRIRSDKGTEYVNRDVKRYLKKEGVINFVTQNIVKASYAERAIKTIKSRLVHYMTNKQSHRWIEVLNKITESYNKTYHRTIMRTPTSVKPKDSVELWKLQYYDKPKGQKYPSSKQSSTKSKFRNTSTYKNRGTRYKFKVGDLVRVSYLRRAFQREYDERWSRELFVVNERFRRESIVQYKLKDYAGEIITGTFYESQLIKAFEQQVYLIEKVIRTKQRGRQKQHLVRWKGWPAKYDSWVGEEDLRNLNIGSATSAPS
jgi:hypothetical protein